MRTIAAVTVARSDYSIQRPVMTAIAAAPNLRLRVMVSGTHLAREFGHSLETIEHDGFPIDDRVDNSLVSDCPEAIAASMGRGTIGFAEAFARATPDLLLVAGDRFELHAAVVAALPFNIPVAHIHGGETTEGAIDEAIRHSITKMSHLHFVATDVYAARVRQMGEEPWRVTVTGAPSLDTVRQVPRLTRAEVEARLGLAIDGPLLLVTFHPVTLQYADTDAHITALLEALSQVDATIVLTYPNADTHGRRIIAAIESFVARRPKAKAFADLGSPTYLSVMSYATAMVGNSSSGIIEAASFGLPVVNIGDRQRGRVAPANVIHVGPDRRAIEGAVATATSPEFRRALAGLANPYGDGHAAERIVARLSEVPLDARLLMKRFAALS